ncbi:MAG: GlsB/YeaQ/YmgE family stress response membrane protein [Candidatus Acidiferrales bacterium]
MLALLWFVVIGIVAGWLAGQITKGSGFGLLGDLIVGVLGSLLGGFLFGLLGFGAYGLIARLLMAVVGAVVLLFLIRLVRRA